MAVGEHERADGDKRDVEEEEEEAERRRDRMRAEHGSRKRNGEWRRIAVKIEQEEEGGEARRARMMAGRWSLRLREATEALSWMGRRLERRAEAGGPIDAWRIEAVGVATAAVAPEAGVVDAWAEVADPYITLELDAEFGGESKKEVAAVRAARAGQMELEEVSEAEVGLTEAVVEPRAEEPEGDGSVAVAAVAANGAEAAEVMEAVVEVTAEEPEAEGGRGFGGFVE